MGWMEERRRRKRAEETPTQAYERIMRAETVISLGVGPLLIPANPDSPKVDTSKAIKQMIRVAQGEQLL